MSIEKMFPNDLNSLLGRIATAELNVHNIEEEITNARNRKETVEDNLMTNFLEATKRFLPHEVPSIYETDLGVNLTKIKNETDAFIKAREQALTKATAELEILKKEEQKLLEALYKLG